MAGYEDAASSGGEHHVVVERALTRAALDRPREIRQRRIRA